VVAAYLAISLIWGTTWHAIRICIADYPTMTAVALRFAIATVVLVPIALRARPWPRSRTTWTYLVIAGVLDAGAYLLVYLGEERVPGSIAAVLYGTVPLFLAMMLAITRIEQMSARHVAGALVSLAGVTVLLLDRLALSIEQASGVLLILGSVVLSTAYSVIMKRHAQDVPAAVGTTVFLAVTAIVLGIAALIAGEPLPWPPPPAATIALLYLAVVGSVVAFLVYFWLLAKTSLLITSTLVFVYPLVALITDALFERELPLDAHSYVGAAITLGGLAVTLRRR
jgi:drug/metabolite transporter (DMT)-like permease